MSARASTTTEDLIASVGASLAPVISEGLSRLTLSLREQDIAESMITREVMRAADVAALIAEVRALGSYLPDTIEPPVLITGFGRTGSTFLLNLMACDPALRAANLWELWRPFPAPRPAHRDYRASAAHAQLRSWSREQLALHPMHAERPDECYWIMPHQHCHGLAYNARSYCQWLRSLGHDQLHDVYVCYRDYVRLLMKNFAGRRWLGKCLAHMNFVPVLHEVFPGAKLVRLHRDPREAVSSYCALTAAFAKTMLPGADPWRCFDLIVEEFADGARRMMHADETLACADVLYTDLVSRPAETVAQLYEKLGLPFSDEFESALAVAAAKAPPPRVARPSLPHPDETKIRDAMAPYIAWAEARWGRGVWTS
jgi:hypothetical protein